MPSKLPRSAVASAVAARSEVRLAGLRGSASAWSIAALLRTLDRPVLVVVADAATAARTTTELRFFVEQNGDDFAVETYPDWDVQPYKGYSPSAAIVRRRIAALALLGRSEPVVVVAPVAAVLKRVVRPAVLARATELLRVGAEIDRDALLARLVERGYLATDLCSEPGSFAVRGGILDLWGPGHPSPLRLEFWGDEIDSIRSFDPWTQRSIDSVTRAVVLPAREEIVDAMVDAAVPAALKALSDERGLPPKARIELTREIADRRLLQELELFLPVLDPDLGTVFDHLADGGVVVVDGPGAIEARLLGRDDELHARWIREGGRERLVPEPSALFLDEEGLERALLGRARIVLPELHDADEGEAAFVAVDAPDHGELRTEILASKDKPEGMLAPLATRVKAWQRKGCDVRVVGSTRQGAQLAALLEAYDLALPFVRGDVARGFRMLDERVVWLSADEVLGPRKRAAAKARRPAGHEAVGSLAQLGRGDLVVHSLHGIGRFQGLTKLQLGASAAEISAEQRARAADPAYKPGSGGRAGGAPRSSNDYLLLEYRGGDRLYLPVHKLDLLSRYVSAGGPSPRLDKLGGQTWTKRRKKVSEEVQKVARELLALYAQRALATSHVFAEPDDYFAEFCAGFEWEETPDQQAAIDAVVNDMASRKPMDRLVCGDVGFGKTEVAMRAAFLAVEDGKQVAVLVPTTILALQHHEAFRARMASFPVRLEMLSRFRTAAQQRRTLKELNEGKVDIVVGTHRLLARDVEFKDLGLLVVDEEHRFGVRHKERIKEMRAGVDVLTMTATPIPRTLHMALSGIRDFSVITTAPEGRQPVRTSVARFSARRISDALRFELDRGGQVFFVHNRVKTIYKMADWLQRMVPDARIGVAHGQMKTSQLESIMLDFFQRKFDVLLSTTIVESGIDVPTANTIILNRADRFGLAQLHQLRGRVGRSTETGFCLLLVPPGRSLRRIALERLRVIQDNADLGSGHRIAQHDLELRGAGNLLGRKQSGHIADVGMVTYMELLEAAVRKLKGEAADVGPDPEVDLKADAWIPADYIPDERDRLDEYKRLADARTSDELAELFEELADRYGRPPGEVLAFEHLIEVKVLCRELRVLTLRMVRGGRLQLTFDPSTTVDPGLLMARVGRHRRQMSFKQDGILLVSLDAEGRRAVVDSALSELKALRQCVVPESPTLAVPTVDPTDPACYPSAASESSGPSGGR